MKIGVLKEAQPETRVSILPEHVPMLLKKGFEVLIESGAGEAASQLNEAYLAKGAIIQDRNAVLAQSDVVLAIQLPALNEAIQFKANQIWIGVFQPLYSFKIMEALAKLGLTVFSLDMLPRTTRAQSMDILSSQANIAGYKAVLTAANLYPRYFPMMMTAAGSIAPAKVLILGAGVAGLQAIATSRRLGAVVEVFDTRPAVKEEVQSLGAKFVEVEGAADASKAGGYAVDQSEEYKSKQRQRIAEAAAKADIVITTAQIPGKKAPILLTEEMIAAMKPGSVIVDLAAATGGNTPYSKQGETVTINHVAIVGNSALASTMPLDASKLYGKNVYNFLELLVDKSGQLVLNFEDNLVQGACVVHKQQVIHPAIQSLLTT